MEWTESLAHKLVPAEKLPRTLEILRKISTAELLRFGIGLDGQANRPLHPGDCAVAVMNQSEDLAFYQSQLTSAASAGASTGCLYFGPQPLPANGGFSSVVAPVFVPVPATGLLLDGLSRVAVKLVMNTLSTCTMVRLGRVMGNYMIWVVPSNLKLIDRATRYISRLTGLAYEPANQLLFEIIEYVEPRMKSDQSYPPVVGMAVLRAREGLTNEAAEKRLLGAAR